MTERIEVPALIVGAGPVGMTAAILLARLGLRSLVVEREDRLQQAPAAHVVNARTFEILRSAGLDMEALAAACAKPADAGFVRWVTTLAGEELGRLPFERQGDEILDHTPTPLRNLSQHRLESILAEHLARLPETEVQRGFAWESCEQDAHGVTSQVRELATGRMREIRSRTLLAADGAGSRVRKALGIEPVGPARLAAFVMIHFAANLRELVRARPAVLYFTTAPGATGAFVAHDIDSTWVYMHGFDAERESLADYGEARCREIVERALGASNYGFQIRTLRAWQMTAQIAARYRERSAFLIGDAAHRFPPTGGLGLNTGVQDAHNLAWKLAAVDAGWAADALLDTYESERRPVARENADVSMRNAARMLEVHQALASGGEPERVRAAIANQAEHFDMLGLQLGYCYGSGALVSDGSAAPAPANPVREFAPSARPGARLPHAWVERAGTRVSTLDLVAHDRFTLIAGSAHAAWCAAAESLAAPPLQVLALGRDLADDGGRIAELLGIAPEGALLVRPDQHVAWRSARGAANPHQELRAAFAQILGA